MLDKDLETTVLKMLKELMKDVEKVKKIVWTNENINKEIKKVQQLKWKYLLEGFEGRVQQPEEKNSKVEDMTMEIIESVKQKEKRLKTNG